ncbi:MAG: hypothetical protein SFU99_08830 [Saprospiraceae bacterium]|nr:hypothetical protein [Saprospiraceae bacterium]
MTVAQISAARTVLERDGVAASDTKSQALLAIGYAHIHTQIAQEKCTRILENEASDLSLAALTIWRVYQYCKDKKNAKTFLSAAYPKILAWHRHLYEYCDPQEEGLPVVEDRQDPVFLTLLSWSNESLIKIGHTLGEDVLEIIQWHELTIYSMNEKLWNELNGYKIFKFTTKEFQQCKGLEPFLPLAAEIPTQDQAEYMLLKLERDLFTRPINLWESWLLYQGLLRYDFIELAAKLRRFLWESMTEFGCYENFDALTGEPILGKNKAQSPVAAALMIDLLKAK